LLVGITMTTLVASPVQAADPVRDSQWHLGFLGVDEAHKYSEGEGVVVGVVDLGVDANHPDLAGSVLPGFVVGAPDDPYLDLTGHGTAMAGLIAAHGRALGIAPRAKVLPVKDGAIVNDTAGGVRVAVDHGAKVLCLAYGGDDNPVDRADVQYAIEHDVVVIAAVGNSNEPSADYPVGYPGVVGAAGVDREGSHAPTSVVTPNADLAAPSVSIYSTDTLYGSTGNGYRTGTGTSDATAIIAGAAALVRAKFPRLSAVEVIHRLTATADDKGPPGRDDQYGYGIVNLVKALTADVPPLTPSAVPTTAAAPAPAPIDQDVSRYVIALLIIAALVAAGVIVGVVRARTR
jgi:subtilisin family serine protease